MVNAIDLLFFLSVIVVRLWLLAWHWKFHFFSIVKENSDFFYLNRWTFKKKIIGKAVPKIFYFHTRRSPKREVYLSLKFCKKKISFKKIEFNARQNKKLYHSVNKKTLCIIQHQPTWGFLIRFICANHALWFIEKKI